MSVTAKFSLIIFAVLLLFTGDSLAQVKKVKSKAPKWTLTFAISYNYATSRAYGDVHSGSLLYDSTLNGYVFKSPNYGMLQGGSILSTGKLAVDRKRRVRLTLTLGYNLFYNASMDDDFKNQWHMFIGAFGIEYNFSPKSKFRPYIGYELMYTLMFGSWQLKVQNPNGTFFENYVKFKPAHRFGMAVNSGVEFRLKKNIGLTLGYRAVWANIAPKLNNASSTNDKAYINDSKDDKGIDIGFRKQIVYMQIVGGVSFYLRRK
jgi:opacity protein-like surface antigen